MCISRLGSVLYQTSKGVKILYLKKGEEVTNLFNANNRQPFNILTSNIEEIGRYKIQQDQLENFISTMKVDVILTASDSEIATLHIIENNFSDTNAIDNHIKICNVNGTMCLLFSKVDENQLNNYYSLFQIIDQIQIIKSKLNLK